MNSNLPPKLVFIFGSMGSAKTAQALIRRYNFMERGYAVVLAKPATDTRDGITKIKSRIGIEADALILAENERIKSVIIPSACDVIIVDEAQFLSESQVDQLREIVDDYGIPVYCYGLRTDFQSHLFEGSKRLFELCDGFEQLPSVCACGKEAVINARVDGSNGRILEDGQKILLGGNGVYLAMCNHCWEEKKRQQQ